MAGWQDLLRADALSALLAACVSVVTVLAAWLGPGLERDDEPRRARRFQIFVNLFAFTMLCAVTTNNVGLMWVAIEATTITSAMLIALDVTKASVEASWKYVLLGSVGIALAFAGTVLAYFDFVRLADPQEAVLNWTVLRAAAPALHPEVVELAFVFILVGYGTKAGLAPMHTWLPDAHAEAPAPLSAMMSGVLLAVALYAIVRWKAVVSAAVGTAFPNRLLVVLGVLSLAIAAFSLVMQRNYKRMLAYSSIEHMGLVCVGLALGTAGDRGGDAASHEPHAGEGHDVPARRAGPPSIPDGRHRARVRPAPGDARDRLAVPGRRAGAGRPAAVRPVRVGVRAAAGRLRRRATLADGDRAGPPDRGLRRVRRPREPDAVRDASGRRGLRGGGVLAAGPARAVHGGARRPGADRAARRWRACSRRSRRSWGHDGLRGPARGPERSSFRVVSPGCGFTARGSCAARSRPGTCRRWRGGCARASGPT